MAEESAVVRAKASENPIAHDANCRPQVTVEREGDVISHIRIQCTCGDVIELACSY
jgi:hypothetical protein